MKIKSEILQVFSKKKLALEKKLNFESGLKKFEPRFLRLEFINFPFITPAIIKNHFKGKDYFFNLNFRFFKKFKKK